MGSHESNDAGAGDGMVSIKDVAKRAGVSVMTASRVVNQNKNVAPAAHEAVMKAVGELGYRPNLTARSLRAKETRLLGLLVPDIENPLFATLSKYVEIEAQRRGYNAVLGNTWEDDRLEAEYLDIMYARRMDGIIILPVSGKNRKQIRDCRVPVVVVDRTSSEPGGPPTVTVDNLEVGALAARHLLGLGHRRFACVTGPLDIDVFAKRREGFARTLADAGHALLAERGVTITGEHRYGEEVAGELLAGLKPPLALFCANDVTALGAMKAALRLGWSIPGDLSLVGVDGIPAGELVVPSLTTVKQPITGMAEAGVSVLLAMLREKDARPESVVLAPELLLRESTGPVAAGPRKAKRK